MIRHMITMPHPPDHKESENWSGNGDKGELPGNTCVYPKYIEVILKSKTAEERLEVEARSVIYKMVKRGIYSPSFNFVKEVVVLLPARRSVN